MSPSLLRSSDALAGPSWLVYLCDPQCRRTRHPSVPPKKPGPAGSALHQLRESQAQSWVPFLPRCANLENLLFFSEPQCSLLWTENNDNTDSVHLSVVRISKQRHSAVRGGGELSMAFTINELRAVGRLGHLSKPLFPLSVERGGLYLLPQRTD